MMSMRQESGVVELHFDCHYKCTLWIINQVKLIGCWAYCRYFIYLIHPFFCMNPLCCPLPLCIHGNSCLLGSPTGNQQCLNRLGSDHCHCGKHTSISVICWPIRVRIQFGLYPCGTGVRVLKRGHHHSWLLLAESQHSVVVLIFLSVTLCILTVFDYYLYGIWNHIDTSQLNNVL
jgi:hypothetical protein